MDTPRFNLALITIRPGRNGPPAHMHDGEDDAFYMVEGELTFILGGSEVIAGPGTLSSGWQYPIRRAMNDMPVRAAVASPTRSISSFDTP